MYSVSSCRLYLELTLTDGPHTPSSRPAGDGGCEGTRERGRDGVRERGSDGTKQRRKDGKSGRING
jgi:hypothetical protein